MAKLLLHIALVDFGGGCETGAQQVAGKLGGDKADHGSS
jgi:hypothetical protein